MVRLDGESIKVRLIGVDAPELVAPRRPVQRFGHESADFLRRLVEGKRVRLAYEPAGARIDRYGRTLAYLYPEPGGTSDGGRSHPGETTAGQVTNAQNARVAHI
jgi:endonuclease YncB( thermonuclease family)